jgi:hypothetical protein
MEIKLTVAHRHVYIVLVQILVHLFTCRTTQALIKCPLFLITFDQKPKTVLDTTLCDKDCQ